jgi:catechol 2,3-dioxygenase-like lactoylglutathione lyase family enzyme
MPIQNILINTSDVARSSEFYTRFLGAEPVGDATDDRTELDVVTATIELVRVDEPQTSTWVADDLQQGFRHVGFKVTGLDALAEELDRAGVPFHLRPLDAEGDVRITFFYAPEGTLLELVEGDLQYHEVIDADGVAAERALGAPSRPRFDHVATTVDDLGSAEAFYAPFGFGRIGHIDQPSDPRGFAIDYLKGGDTVLEVFTYGAQKQPRSPQLGAPGFVAAGLEGSARGDVVGEPAGAARGGAVYSDPDGLAFQVV